MLQIGEWGVALSVLGLLTAMVLLASLQSRRQIHQAAMREAVRPIEVGALRIVDALTELRGVRLSRELRVTLRTEVLARYRRIGRLYPRYPRLRQLIADAEAALRAEGEPIGSGVGRIDGDTSFRRLNAALGALMMCVGREGTLQPIPADVRAIFYRELGERRAEVWARFHLVEAARHEANDRVTRARTHLTTLMHGLRSGPRTPFVNALYEEAEQALIAVGRRAVDAEPSATDQGARTAIATRRPLAGELSI